MRCFFEFVEPDKSMQTEKCVFRLIKKSNVAAAYLFLNAEKNRQKVVVKIRNSSEKRAEEHKWLVF